MKIITTMRYHLSPLGKQKLKTVTITNVGKMLETCINHKMMLGMWNGIDTLGNIPELLFKFKHRQSCNSISCYLPKKN